MTELNDNVMNQQFRPDEQKFKLWKNAGLMLSYWCPSRCRCCYVHCGPEAGSAGTEMPVELALWCWRGIRDLAGDKAKVHITGGEPFGNYERLRKILQEGCGQGLGGLEKIETNAYWCTNSEIVRKRLEELKHFGLTKLQISTDIYHQEYIPIERVRLCESVGQEVLGEQGIQVRWRDFLANPVLIRGLSESQRLSAVGEQLSRRSERLVGRAAEELVKCFPSRNYNEFADENCAKRILGAGHVHIDGAGNVFSGTCIGIRLANLKRDNPVSLEQLWKGWDYRTSTVLHNLVERGPIGLAELATEHGWRASAGYAGKCHLCYEVRKYLYRIGMFRQELGPGVCYGMPDEADRASCNTSDGI